MSLNSVCTISLTLMLVYCLIGYASSDQGQEQEQEDDTLRQGKEYSYTSSSGNLPSYSKPLYSGYYTGSSGSGSDATWGTVHPVDDIKPGPAPPSWQTPSYPPDKVVISYPSENCLPGLSDIVRGGGSSKLGIVKAGLIALIAALIAKLPVLLLIKAFIFKLIVVPLGFLFFALPVLLPILYFVLPNMMGGMMNGGMGMMGMMTTTTPQPATTTEAGGGGQRRSFQVTNQKADLDHVLKSLLGSSKCLEQIACKLGARDANSNYKNTVSWLLKALQNLVPPKNTAFREKLKSYRQAYNLGANNKEEVCDQRLFPCDIPKLMVTQEKNTFRII